MRSLCSVINSLLDMLGNKVSSGVINVGSGEARSILTIAQEVQKVFTDRFNLLPSLKFDESTNVYPAGELYFSVEKLSNYGLGASKQDHYMELNDLSAYCIKVFS